MIIKKKVISNETYWFLMPGGQRKNKSNIFKGKEVTWQEYRLYDKNKNSENRITKVAIMPWRFTLMEEKEFKEKFMDDNDPYIRFYRCKNRTIIHHCEKM